MALLFSGLPDHIGPHCHRPNLETCARNEESVLMEIERAGTVRSVESSLMEANTKQNDPLQRNRGRHRSSRCRNGKDNAGGGKDFHGDNPRNRGRPVHREELPHFRPFKSMPPPSHPQNQFKEDQSHKRQRGDLDGSIASPLKSKRARYK
jgi:hypothetical protein